MTRVGGSDAPFVRTRGSLTISTERARIDVDAVHAALTRTYWAEGIPRETVAAAIDGALCFAVYDEACGGTLVGFARAITDSVTFAYLADVYVLESYRGRGIGNWLIETIVGYPGFDRLRRFLLVTRDAAGLYARHGFTPLRAPEKFMEISHSAAELYGDAIDARVEPSA